MFSKSLSQYFRDRRALRRTRLKRLRLSNSLLIGCFVVCLPIYPVFGSIIYDGSQRDVLRSDIDEASIIAEYTDETDVNFISSDVPVTGNRDWSGREGIESYVVQSGDTISELASSFSISANSIRWSNNITSNTLKVGQELLIPPADGIIYVVKSGDTLDAIAKKYKTTTEKIQTSNTNVNPLIAGSTIFLPGAQKPITPAATAAAITSFTFKVINKDGYRFVPGQCTYFVAKYWPVKWRGHARYWFKNAKAAGFQTGQTAKVGAIVVWYGPGYNLSYGHVGIVTSVNTKAGTMVVRDMNYAGPWKITTRVEKLKNKYIIGYIYYPSK